MNTIKQTTPEEILGISKRINTLRSNGKEIEIIFDTETTGTNHTYDRVLEFGAVIMADGVEVEKVHFYANPYLSANPPKTKDIPKEAVKVHNITRAFLEGENAFEELFKDKDVSSKENFIKFVKEQSSKQKDEELSKIFKEYLVKFNESDNFEEVKAEFLNILQDKMQAPLETPAQAFSAYSESLSTLLSNQTLIAHNAKFDIGMINAELNRDGISTPINESATIIDTISLFRTLITKAELEERGLKGYKLDTFIDFAKQHKDFKEIDRTFHGALLDSEILQQAYEIFKPIAKDMIDLIHAENSGQILENKKTAETKADIKSNIYFKTDRALNEGSVDIKEIVQKAKENGIETLTIMDTYRTNGHRVFDNIAKEEGIKAQYGSTIYLEIDGVKTKVNIIIKNQEGYKDFNNLLTMAFENNEDSPYLTEKDFQKKDSKGRISSFKNLVVSIPQTDNNIYDVSNKVREITDVEQEQPIFIEPISKERMDKDAKEYNGDIKNIKTNLTHEVLFTNDNDFEAYQTLNNITRGDEGTGAYFKNYFTERKNNSFNTEMIAKEEAEKGLEQEFDSNEITYEMEKRRTIFPKYPVDLNLSEEDEKSLSENDKKEMRHKVILDEFIEKAREGLKVRITELNPTPEEEKILNKRLEVEIQTILEMEEMQKDAEDPMAYAEYYLFVQDYVNWSKNNNVLIGPGRGSGAGSLIAYAMRITDVEVNKFDLVFERFINKERVSEPDFDVDFAGIIKIDDIQDEEVKAYVKKTKGAKETLIGGKELALIYMSVKYPKAQVAKTLTEGTIQAKSAISDVVKVFGDEVAQILYDNNTELASLIKEEFPSIKDTLRYVDLSNYLKTLVKDDQKSLSENIKANKTLKKLYETSNIVRKILDISLQVENKIKSYGAHAGAVVLDFDIDKPIGIINGEYVYLQTMYDSELVKFDFLGLKTLDVIHNSLETIKNRLNIDIDFDEIDYRDKATFDKISEGDTKGMFQIESQGMQALNKEVHPTSIEDIIAILALYRPGPMEAGMLDDFIARKNGADVNYNLGEQEFNVIANTLEGILEPTLGVVVYQEQVLRIVREIAGFSYGEADLVRRAMGKKNLEKMKEISEEFSIRANSYLKETQGIDFPKESAKKLFSIIESFAGYGFNKSHSAGYAMLTFETAYIKTHYPIDFYTAHFNNRIDKVEKLGEYIVDAQEHKIDISAPNINKSQAKFDIHGETIMFALEGIKGVGEAEVEKIINERVNGEFQSLEDLLNRVFLKKNTMEGLILSGAFDELNPTSENRYEDREAKLKIYYDFEKGKKKPIADKSRKQLSGTTEGDFYVIEKELLGNAITAKNILDYQQTQDILNSQDMSLEERMAQDGFVNKYQVVLSNVKEIKTKKGDMMAFVTFTDGKTTCEGVCFPKYWAKFKDNIQANKVVSLDGKIDYKDGSNQLIVNNMTIVPITNTTARKAEIVKEESTKPTQVSESKPANMTNEKVVIKREAGYIKIKGQLPAEIKEFLEEITQVNETINYHSNGDFWSFQVQGVEAEDVEYNEGLYKKISSKVPHELIVIPDTVAKVSEQQETVIEQDKRFAVIKNLRDEQVLELLKEVKQEDFIVHDEVNDSWRIRIFSENTDTVEYDESDIQWNVELINKIKNKIGVPFEILTPEESNLSKLSTTNSKELYKKAKASGITVFAPKGTVETNAIIMQEFLPTSIAKKLKENHTENLATQYFDFFLKQDPDNNLKPMLFVLDYAESEGKAIDANITYNFIQLLSETNEIELIVMPLLDMNSPIVSTLKLKKGMNEVKIGATKKKIYVADKDLAQKLVSNIEEELDKEQEVQSNTEKQKQSNKMKAE